MTTTTQLWVTRSDLRHTKIVQAAQAPLRDGEIRVAIDKMGLTANNVSYAVSGDMIGYWKYFPAEGEWGKVPGWAMGDVVESRSDVIAEGVVAAVKEVGLKVPLVVRLEGTNVEKGKEIINTSGLNVIAADDLKDGAQKIVAAVKG